MPATPDFSPTDYQLRGLLLADLSEALVAAHSAAQLPGGAESGIEPEELSVDFGLFVRAGDAAFPAVTLSQQRKGLTLSCPCEAPKTKLCEHQAAVLRAVLQRRELRLFFDKALRREFFLPTARQYGLETEADLDLYLSLSYQGRRLEVSPKHAGLYAFTPAAQAQLVAALLPAKPAAPPTTSRLVVLGRHKYYEHPAAYLFEAAFTAGGKPKNPLLSVPPLDAGLGSEQLADLRFYAALARLQQQGERTPQADWESLRALVQNPLNLPIFTSEGAVTDRLAAPALQPLTLRIGQVAVQLTVRPQGALQAISASLTLNGQPRDLRTLPLKLGAFLALPEAWYLVDRPELLRLISFFKSCRNELLLPQVKFAEFQRKVLGPLEAQVPVSYLELPPATPAQLVAHGFSKEPEHLLYLSATGDAIDLLPVLKYGAVEVPILSRQLVYTVDNVTGKPFRVPRDAVAEAAFAALLLHQQPAFAEQLQLDRPALYLSRRQFLEDDWFLDAFEGWQERGITVLGFDELNLNKLSPHKARVTICVSSEANWFDTELHVRIGRQLVPLARLHQAVRKRSRYVRLDDGTQGLLPEAWLAKFARYFAAGELAGEHLRTPRIGFAAVAELYESEDFTPGARQQLARLQEQVAGFAGIAPVAPPAGLRGTLRPYQQHGLNWLHFLAKFGFGGCLADDMGLGKTITVLAFLLGRQAEQPGRTSLVVVPTSLVFNWQNEATKFAPGLRLLTLHGPGRARSAEAFAGYDVVLTTYGTMLSDIAWLRKFGFHYAVLDESQAIKNPDSQRHRAARLLQAQGRLVLTGTPLENNTYDLYGQLAFACPGLLGSARHFREQFAEPIDKFQSDSHARALRRRIAPFVLRRTKQQVAPELPARTELLRHCPMPPEQRRIYDYHKKLYREQLMGHPPDDLPAQRLHVLQGLTRLRQICDAPALLATEEDYGPVSAKLDVLLSEIDAHAPEHKILVFSQFVAMLDLIRAALRARGIAHEYLTGQTKNRAAAVANFQENPAVRVFLISLKAGGTGLNLTAADYVYLVDPWWNPAAEAQAIDRSHRLGQDKPVVAIRLVCPDTVEEKILTLQERKQDLAQNLVRTDAAALKALTRAELLALFE